MRVGLGGGWGLHTQPPLIRHSSWATKHYVCATRFQFLGAQVATKALESVCSNASLSVPLWCLDVVVGVAFRSM